MNWKERLKIDLEPVLTSLDPRGSLSAYHDMPYGIFRYPPEAEFDLRAELDLLKTRLENAGKRVTRISLAESLGAALEAEGIDSATIAEAEVSTGTQAMIDTIFSILAETQPLVNIVAARLPTDLNPLKDVVLINRTGAMFPVYRTHALLEQLKGRLTVPAVLFYPGQLDGPTGLSFMGVLDPDPNYRPRIF